jgi:predicted HTH domain antitoxin
MTELILQLPESAFSITRSDKETFGKELILAAAMKWFEMGKISSGKAALLVGIARVDFLCKLKEFQISPFQYTAEEVLEELKLLDA